MCTHTGAQEDELRTIKPINDHMVAQAATVHLISMDTKRMGAVARDSENKTDIQKQKDTMEEQKDRKKKNFLKKKKKLLKIYYVT